MLVRNWMRHSPITVGPDDSLQEAVALLKKHNIHMLPVIEGVRLAGVITDLDIRRAAASEIFSLEDPEPAKSISRIKVRALMKDKPITLTEDRTIEEAAALFFVHNMEKPTAPEGMQ